MNTKNRHYVLDRLNTLNTIKNLDDLVLKQQQWKKKVKAQRTKPKQIDRTDVKTDLSLTVKLTKDAELLAGVQEYEFMPMDDDARRNIPLFKEIWNYRWMISRTDKVLSKVIPSATAYGTGIMYEGVKTVYKEIKEPIYDNDGNITFEDKTIVDYDGVYCEYIPWENFFIDGDDIDNANEAIWMKYRDREEFINAHKLDSKYYNISEIPMYKDYTEALLSDDPKYNQEDENVILEIKYYNVSKDEYIVLANGVEVLKSPIPYKHKMLPFTLFYDYKVDGRIYGMGEFELLQEDELFKDKLRSLSIDVIKAQMGIVLIEDDIDLEEATFEYGTATYTRVDNINGIKHFSPSISTNSIDNAELKLDNDIIAKTGVDIRAQQFTSGETAKKTIAKTEVAKKRINLNLKINGFDFFERLGRIRTSNIKMIMSNGNKKIPIKGRDITDEGTVETTNGGYGFFIAKPKHLKGEFNLIPITQTILGNTAELNKQRALEFDQIVGNIVGEDGRPVVSGENRIARLCDVFEIDYEKLTSSVDAEKKPDDIMREMQNELKGVSNDTLSPENPGYIPPEQRSGATKMLSGSNISSLMG